MACAGRRLLRRGREGEGGPAHARPRYQPPAVPIIGGPGVRRGDPKGEPIPRARAYFNRSRFVATYRRGCYCLTFLLESRRSIMSNETDRELARLWRVSRTVHEMVRDRVRICNPAILTSPFLAFPLRPSISLICRGTWLQTTKLRCHLRTSDRRTDRAE